MLRVRNVKGRSVGGAALWSSGEPEGGLDAPCDARVFVTASVFQS